MSINEGLEAVNNIRKQHALPPYEQNDLVDAACKLRVEYMAERNKLDHYEGSHSMLGVEKRLQEVGFNYSSFSENIAWGQETVEEACQDFMGDWGHRRTMLAHYKYCSMYSADASDGRKYWCLDVASEAE